MIDDIKFWKGSTAIGAPLALFDAAERDWSTVFFQPERPVLEGELNLMQQSANRRMRDLLRGIYPKGGVLKAFVPSATGVTNEVRVHTENAPFYAVLDGIMKPVFAYDDPAVASPAVGGNRITLPAHTGGSYDELVYLEVWFEEIKSPEGDAGPAGDADTTVYQYGMVGNFTLSNDILVSAVPLAETTRRIQLRGQIKVATASTLAGILAKDVAGYGYGIVGDTHFYRAGAGDNTSGLALNSVDGYVYGLPLFVIDRNDPVVVNDDITIATPIIPTGSDVADDIQALEDQLGEYKTVSVIAGIGLTGGGLLEDDVTLNVFSTDARNNNSPAVMLQSKGMYDHVGSGDHDSRYYTKTQLGASGGAGDTVHADRVNDGVLGTARIPNLNADKTTAGVFHVDRIPNLDAGKITSGTFGTARIPNLDAGKTTSGTFVVDRIPNLDAAKITSGQFPTARYADGSVTPVKTSFFNTVGSSGRIWVGHISSSGSVIYLPSGLSCTRTGTGTYRITHGQGTSNMIATVTVVKSDNICWVATTDIDSQYLWVRTYSSSSQNALTDAVFYFILVRY